MNILQLIATCAPLIHPDTALAVMAEESNFNRFAIGVVNSVVKQPTILEKALETANKLEFEGYNYSVGLMQINKINFSRYGVTLAQMFDPCENLKIAEKILIDCYQRSGSVNDALSCYYSGNFLRGYKKDFRNTSYVERVHAQVNTPVPDKRFEVPSLNNEPLIKSPSAGNITKNRLAVTNTKKSQSKKRVLVKNLPKDNKYSVNETIL